jgi:hypothetical protein
LKKSFYTRISKIPFKKVVLLCCLLVTTAVFAQPNTEKGLNLPAFYKKPIHFGFCMGYDNANFQVHTVPNSQLSPKQGLVDSVLYPGDTLNLKSVISQPNAGFHLGIICDARLHKYVRIRFLPTLIFTSHQLDYSFTGTRKFTVSRKSESSYVMFPLNIKLQSKRLQNMSVYVLGGGRYCIDLASGKKDRASNEAVRIKQNDWYLEGGAGVDFYLKYFKFSVEARMMQGLRNMIIKDGTEFTTPINSLNSHIFQVSINFEG